MIFWFGAALLTLIALGCIVLPFRRARIGTPAFAHDREVYLARQREIDTDLSLGRINAAEAEAARAEDARRLLALSAASSGESEAPTGNAVARMAMIAALVFVPAFSGFAYFVSGAPGYSDMALATRPDIDPERQSITQLLERAEAQLAKNPSDVRGWVVVAPVYLRLGRADDAVNAWRNAARLEPENAQLRISLAEAITAAAGGIVTAEAREMFEGGVAALPEDARSRFYLAIAMGQAGDNEKAREAWQKLIGEAPADAPWVPVAKAQLQEIEKKLGIAPSETAEADSQPGPTQEDIAAAQGMSAQDRQAMIESMVASLDEKLKADPSDKQGWLRLLRAYGVLGKKDDMRRVADTARQKFTDDADFLAQVEALLVSASQSQPLPAGEGN